MAKKTTAPVANETLPTLHSNLPILEVNEKWLLDTLFHDTQANRMLVMRLDDCTALVMPNQYDNLIARLRKLGHTPRILER
jgi:hypothetical protein